MHAGEWLSSSFTLEWDGKTHRYKLVYRDVAAVVVKLLKHLSEFEPGFDPDNFDYRYNGSYSVPQTSKAFEIGGEWLVIP